MSAEDQSLPSNFDQVQEGPIIDIVRAGFKATVKKAGGSIRDLGNVPVDALRVRKGYNVRLHGKRHDERIEAVAQSILANGYREDKPFTCSVEREGNDEVIYLVSGHTRLEAIKRANERGANITTVPVLCIPEGTNEVDLTLDLVLSNDGAPLTMYEQGIVNERLIKQGLSMTEIARRQGFTEGHVRNTLELRTAPSQIVQWLADGVIAETFALKTIRKHGARAVKVIEKGLEKAAELGKTKVTAATVEGPKIPPKVGVAAVSAVESFISKLDSQVLEKVVGGPEGGEALDDAPVTVPAGLLRELMSANKEIEEFRNALVEKEEKAKERLIKAQERDARREARQARKAEAEARKAERLAKGKQAKTAKESKASAGATCSLSAASSNRKSVNVVPFALDQRNDAERDFDFDRDHSDANELPDYEAMMNQAEQ